MDNCICIFNTIYTQVYQVLESLTASQVTTGGSTFSHTGGFGDSVPTLQAPSTPGFGRFSTGTGSSGGSDNGMMTFVMIAFLFIMMVMSGALTGQAPQRNRQDLKIGRNNNNQEQNNHREDDYYD
eukprot:403373810